MSLTYDIAPDGERFLMLKEVAGIEDEAPRRLHIVLNWAEELERLVPTP